MNNVAKTILLDLIVFDNKERFISYFTDEIYKNEMFELLDNLKPYLTQYLKDKGVFDEEGTKIALKNSLDYEKNELEKEKKDVEEQEIKVCHLEQKIKELGVKL